MKKVIIISFIVSLIMVSCTKSNNDITINNVNRPILIKVDAEHNDGGIVSSPIVVVR